MPVADIGEAEPPDLALVRLGAIGPPALRAPPAMEDEKPAVRDAEELDEADVRQTVEINVAGEAADGRGRPANRVRPH